MTTEQIIKILECCSTREGDCENCPLDKAATINCQWVLLSLCLDVIKKQQGELTYCYDKLTELEKECLGLSLHNITLKKEKKYLRERLAEEAEIKEDMEGKDGH